MLIKIAVLALSTSIVLYITFYLPQRLRSGRGSRIRYVIFSIIAFLFAVLLLKVFL